MSRYWIIDYSIGFRSDFHVGAGFTVFGGNLHGLRVGEDGFPYMPHTQVRGLLRLGGWKIKNWQSGFGKLFEKNFSQRTGNGRNSWSYTSAFFPRSITASGMSPEELLDEQSHIKISGTRGTAENLFSFQKAGFSDEASHWVGSIYSIEPAEERDVAFLIACMRAEDRIGHRRTRGYGKIEWTPTRVRSHEPGKKNAPVKVEEENHNLEQWFNLLFSFIKKGNGRQS